MFELTRKFKGIYVDDCTSVNLPSDIAEEYHGCGGTSSSKGKGAIKTFCRFEVLSGVITNLFFSSGKTADIKMQAEADELPAGSLHLCDRGFFDIERLRCLSIALIWWITRIPAGTTVKIGELDLPTFLHSLKTDFFDVEATLGKVAFSVRLVGFRVDPQTAERHRRNLYKSASKHNRYPSKLQLSLCDWAFYATNLTEEYDIEAVSILYRIRWQIELLFKLFKSEGQLDKSHGRKGFRCLCEFYAKLFGLLLANWFMLQRCGPLAGVSRTRMFRTIKDKICTLFDTILHEYSESLEFILSLIFRKLSSIPPQHKRKKHPSIKQLLDTKKLKQTSHP